MSLRCVMIGSTVYADGKFMFLNHCATLASFKLADHAYGGTGYIDGVKISDFGEDPLMTGVDRHGRRFVSVRVETVHPEEFGGSLEERTSQSAVTFFQRYTNYNGVWVNGGKETLWSGACGYNENDEKNFEMLIRHQTVVNPSGVTFRMV